MNIPKTKTKENIQAICTCLGFLNDLNVSSNVSLLEMPDIPRGSCKRGLADEEASIQTCVWSCGQHCDTRYIVNFDVPTHEKNHVYRTDSTNCPSNPTQIEMCSSHWFGEGQGALLVVQNTV